MLSERAICWVSVRTPRKQKFAGAKFYARKIKKKS